MYEACTAAGLIFRSSLRTPGAIKRHRREAWGGIRNAWHTRACERLETHHGTTELLTCFFPDTLRHLMVLSRSLRLAFETKRVAFQGLRAL